MSHPDLDTENLMMLKELLAEKFTELIDTYLSDSELRIKALKSALSDGAVDAARHEVHGLKGSSRNIGANALADLCEVLESQASEGSIDNEQQQLAAIEQKFADTASVLRTYL